MRVLLLFALLVASANAQGARSEPLPGHRTLMGVGGAATGAGAVALVYVVVLGETIHGDGGDLPLLVAAYPVGLTVGTVLVAEALGYDAPLGRTSVDAFVGVGAGAAVGLLAGGVAGGATYLISQDDWGLVSGLVGLGVGALTTVGVSSVVASRRVEMAPATLRAPMGEPGAGLSLRVAL